MSPLSKDSVTNKNGGKSAVSQFLAQNMILIALIVLCIILAILTNKFLTVKNVMNILIQSTTMGVVAIGMTFVIVTGGIDLSVGSVVALAAALGAGTMKAGLPFGVGILVMFVVATVFGAAQGLLISYVKMPAFIVTLGGMSIGRGLLMVYLQGKTISGLPSEFQFLGSGYIFNVIPVVVIILAVTFIIAFYILKYTTFGRGVYALGGNREATELSGINTKKIETCVYTISGLMSGLGAMILAARLGSAVPTAGEGLEMDAIGAVVIGGASLSGGAGTIRGTIIGILILGVLNNGMNLLNVDPFFEGVVQGAVILIAVFIDTMKKRKEIS